MERAQHTSHYTSYRGRAGHREQHSSVGTRTTKQKKVPGERGGEMKKKDPRYLKGRMLPPTSDGATGGAAGGMGLHESRRSWCMQDGMQSCKHRVPYSTVVVVVVCSRESRLSVSR
jgi:hypothetical protein